MKKYQYSKFHIYILLLLIILVSGLLYKNSFTAYFFQDDWFSLRMSNAKNIQEVIAFFIPRSDVVYYRPLGMQIPFYILHRLFGLNSIPYHILIFLTHSVNICLIFFLIKLFTKKNFIPLLVSYLYSISLIHYIPFYWFATYAFVFGPTLFFLTFILFKLFIDNKKKIYYFLSLITFLIGLLINEMLLPFPVILFSHLWIFGKKSLIKKVFPFIYLDISYLLIRFNLSELTKADDYKLNIGWVTLNNFKTYLLWSFNWPEEMRNQFISFWKINPQFIIDFQFYFYIFLISLIVNIILLVIIPICFLKENNFSRIKKTIKFSLIWFIAGLLPVIFFSKHFFSYYLPISFVGLFLGVIVLFDNLITKIYKLHMKLAYLLTSLLVVNWMVSVIVASDFNQKIHWAPRRSKISKQLIQSIISEFPEKSLLAKNILVPLTDENTLALNNQDGLKVYFSDEEINTVYFNQ